MSLSEPWTTVTLADGEWIRRDFGALSIIVLNHHEEWRIAHFGDGPPKGIAASGQTGDLPAEIVWQRWDHDPNDQRLSFRPAFPTMPVVARPHSVLHLSPKGQAAFFIGIPACIEVVVECQKKMLPLEGIPTLTLSKTWHGTPLVGRLGYALRTYARRVFVREQWPAFEILCPVSIVNEGTETLPFERLYLETDHLSVFEKDGQLWSNAARIRAGAAGSDMSAITYATRPVAPYQDAVELTVPRKGKIRRSTVHSAFSKVLGHLNILDDAS